MPAGYVMIQVEGTPDPKAIWSFTTEPEQYEIVDSKQTPYAPNGVMATYKGAGGDHLLLDRFRNVVNVHHLLLH